MSEHHLYAFDGETLEHFNLGLGTSDRFHVAGLRRFEWSEDRKGRFVLEVESLLGLPLLLKTTPAFPVTGDLATAANAFAADVRSAIAAWVARHR